MKTIFLIEPIPGRIGNIKSYLAEINARVLEFKSVAEAGQSDDKSDLLVLLADRDILKFSADLDSISAMPFWAGVPRLSLFLPEMCELLSTAEFLKHEISLCLPADKARFIGTLASLLKIPARRVFQIIINIQAEGDGVRQTGVSVDFSESGMAFECAADFSIGQKTVVTFVTPKSRKRLALTSIIVRKKEGESGGRHFYGVNFSGLDERALLDLAGFIKGEE